MNPCVSWSFTAGDWPAGGTHCTLNSNSNSNPSCSPFHACRKSTLGEGKFKGVNVPEDSLDI
jgi:hypothetical protein